MPAPKRSKIRCAVPGQRGKDDETMAQDIIVKWADVRRTITRIEVLEANGHEMLADILRRSERLGKELRCGFAELYDALKITWIPCEERMPILGKKVWAWCTAEGGFSFWGHWNWQEPIWVDPCGKGPYPVSHWAEIRWPEPPAN